ncbi:MAG: hypothetical protein ACJ8FY_26550 [Gemmataceae bacterium]
MAQNGTASPVTGSWLHFNPWMLLFSSLVLGAIALGVRYLAPEAIVPLRAFLIFGSCLAAGGAISLRMQSASWDFEERTRTAALVVGAALIGIVNYLAMDSEWDSLRLALRVFIVVGFAGSAVILLSRVFQRIVISLLLVFHFAGILSAVTSVAPPNSTAPWISIQMWTRVFRPYLYFMYLTNAYHFYSPDPGPATLLWFYVKFEDGTGEWYRLADKKDFGTRQEYQRMLAITESTNQVTAQLPPDNIWDAKVLARKNAGNFNKEQIPLSRDYAIGTQYREPNIQSRDMTASYAQYVANHYHSQKDPNLKVKSVKVYRVIHIIVNGDSLAEGIEPWDPTLYLPYYHGEFNSSGEILDRESPFLYWLIHTEAKPKPDTPARYLTPGKRPPSKYLDYVYYWQKHAETTGPDPVKD